MSNFKIQNADREPNLGNYIIPDYVKRTVAVDLGSNLCLFEKKYHDRFDEIFYFEANFSNFLKGTSRVLSKGIKNCFGFNYAVTDNSGDIIKIYSANSMDSGSKSILNHTGANTSDYHKIMTISLDDIFQLLEIERINYLKIDVEGAEHSILMNCDLSKIDFIAAEIHNIMGIDKMDEVRNKILETHEIVSQIKAIPDVRNEETNFKLRG